VESGALYGDVRTAHSSLIDGGLLTCHRKVYPIAYLHHQLFVVLILATFCILAAL
jgi:hypothetical protein